MPARGGLFVSAFLAVGVVDQVVISSATKSCYTSWPGGREKCDNVGRLISGIAAGRCDAVAYRSSSGCNPCPEPVRGGSR
eukprot:CAMPEP_0201139280 /NCGR_PEP_ID=MMETSP0851-20130426/722_1 /ASSEMBLY_ACC=CAM_ASM_000631 /TAXON_ID=183588 /ORGANISM="Pseudo-nitzschia fraudulenta, Strain WWA7" /LENGTH=79 /DNA_ID=CAMNT_0047411051 /DNA_START=1 /DNA_END=240 /DNA_ORIENTATION=+